MICVTSPMSVRCKNTSINKEVCYLLRLRSLSLSLKHKKERGKKNILPKLSLSYLDIFSDATIMNLYDVEMI